ncbi:hypothetical protein GBA52_025043 [Prunus armeniaca]|nr:hypothetical protein GBA52_025043 [Prunus armeniaca]
MVNGKNMSNASPRQSNYGNVGFDEEAGGVGMRGANGVYPPGNSGYPAPPTAGIFSPVTGPNAKKKPNGADGGKDLHMFVWSSSASPVSEGGIHVFRGGEYGNDIGGVAHQKDYDEFGRDEFSFDNRPNSNGVDQEGPVLSKLGSSSTTELHPKAAHGEPKATAMPPASVMTRLILIMVARRYARNVARSIAILSDAGLGMAMLVHGITTKDDCLWKFQLHPLPRQFDSSLVRLSWRQPPIAVGLRGVLLHIAIVQAALPTRRTA